jgi:hypothetical protein
MLAVTAAAGAPAPPNDRFELSAELEARVAVHQDLLSAAGRSADDFCALAADTVTLVDPVALELSRFGGGEHRSVPVSEIARVYTRTERLIPGLSLKVTEEVTQTGIDYRLLGKLAPPEARPLLHALDAFEVGPAGVESWSSRIADESTCAAPERGRGALATLVKSWAAAPGCLRDAFRPRLSQDLDRMVSGDSFCAARERALSAVRKSAQLLKALPDLHGPELADRWIATARAPDAHFGVHPG